MNFNTFATWVRKEDLEHKECQDIRLGLYEAKSVIDFIQDNT